MLRILFLIACFCINILYCNAQSTDEQPKKFTHYIGVQANELFKQILNLNNSNTAIENPYLFTYSLKSNKSGWCLNAGFGFDYLRIEDKYTPSNHESKINNSFYRIGFGRKFMIGKRLETGFGLDFIGDYQLNETFTTSVVISGSLTDSTATLSTDKTVSAGGGLQGSLGFYITPRLILGTEATYYYLASNNKLNVTSTETQTFAGSPSSDSVTLSSDNSETDNDAFKFTIPVALFLIITF